jgi:hypothetical protein
MSGAAYSLESRRADFAASADLTRAGELIDLVLFEAPETIAPGTPIGVIVHDAAFGAGDLGWRRGEGLAATVPAAAGERLVLSIRAEAVRAALAEQRATAVEGGRVIEIAFTTTIAHARGVQASGRRRLVIQPVVAAPAPVVGSVGQAVDLGGLAALTGLRVGAVDIAVPADLALVEQPGVDITIALESATGDELTLTLDPVWSGSCALAPLDGLDPRLARWRLTVSDPRALAGQRLQLAVGVTGPGLLRLIDQHFARNPSGEARLALSAILTGWLLESGSPRLWRINTPDRHVTLIGARSGVATVALEGSAMAWRLDEPAVTLDAPAIAVGYDLDAPRRSLTLPEPALRVAGWPVARQPVLSAVLRLTTADGAVQEARETLTLAASAETGSRTGRFVLRLNALAADLLRQIEASAGAEAEHAAVATLDIASQDGPDASILTVRLPLVARPYPRRVPMCLDIGERGVVAWCVAESSDAAGLRLQMATFGEEGDAARHILPSPIALEDEGWAPRLADRLPLRAMPGVETGVRFAGVAGRAAGPKARLLRLPGQGAAAPRQLDQRRPSGLMADAVTEVVARKLVPIFPDLRRSDEVRTRLVPRLVLTHPAGLGGDAEAAYGVVADLVGQRLEPFFPGSAEASDLVTLVSEAVAAARFGASRLAAAATPATRLIALDMGATAVNAALVDLAVSQVKPLAAFSLPLGGDALLEALTEVVAFHLAAALPALSAGWAQAWPGAALLEARQGGHAGRAQAFAELSQGVAAAQERLAARALSHATDTGGRHDWPADGEDQLAITLCRIPPDAAPQGLLVPRGPVTPGDVPVQAGVSWTVSGGDVPELRLLLSRAAVDAGGEASRRLAAIVRALAVTVPRMVRSAAAPAAERPVQKLFVTGRAALWPPLYAAIEAAAAEAGDGMTLARPLPPEQMKLAVSAGAALIAAEGALADCQPKNPAPLAIAVMSVRVGGGSDMASTSFVAERLLYLSAGAGALARDYEAEAPSQPSLAGRVNLGRRFAFVRCAPGLDPQGRVIAELREAMGSDPLRVIAGDAVVDAGQSGVAAFGPCDISTVRLPDGALHVTVAAIDAGWRGEWTIRGDRAVRREADQAGG